MSRGGRTGSAGLAGITAALRRRPWPLILGLGLLVSLPVLAATRGQDHHLRVAFADAVLISQGLDVRLDGLNVGKVTDVAYEDGQAVVTLGIDERAWPLRQGTKAAIRFGSTIGSGTRRIDLVAGPADAPALPENGVLAAVESITPVEFDELFDTFSRRTRKHAGGLAERGARALAGRGGDLNRGLRLTPSALDALDGVLADLAEQRHALRALVPAANGVVGPLAARADRVNAVVVAASETMGAFAERSSRIAAAISRLPSTLAESRLTLDRLRSSSGRLQPMLAELRPGAAQLADLAPPLGRTLTELRRTMPAAHRVVDGVLGAAPSLGRFLDTATPFARDELAPALTELTPLLQCLAPYTPELAGFASTWAGFAKYYDSRGHYGRFHILQGPTSLSGAQGVTPEEVARDPRITYARYRPPGFSVGQPRWIGRCGIDRSMLVPSPDREGGS